MIDRINYFELTASEDLVYSEITKTYWGCLALRLDAERRWSKTGNSKCRVSMFREGVAAPNRAVVTLGIFYFVPETKIYWRCAMKSTTEKGLGTIPEVSTEDRIIFSIRFLELQARLLILSSMIEGVSFQTEDVRCLGMVLYDLAEKIKNSLEKGVR